MRWILRKNNPLSHRIPRLAAACCLAWMLCGCYFGQFSNVEKADSLRNGMTKDQVRELMGTPEEHLTDATPDIWFYFVRTRWHDAMVTEDECMPVVFSNGKVIGWGNQFYNRFRLDERNFYNPDAFTRDEPRTWRDVEAAEAAAAEAAAAEAAAAEAAAANPETAPAEGDGE